jgi:hypothetical protein
VTSLPGWCEEHFKKQANMDKGKQLPGSHLLAGVCFLLPVQLHVAVVMGHVRSSTISSTRICQPCVQQVPSAQRTPADVTCSAAVMLTLISCPTRPAT